MQHSRKRVFLATLAMALGGLLPVGLGLVGLWGYVQRGFVLSRGGEPMADAWAWYYGLLIIGGLVLIACGVRFYRDHRRSGD